MFVKNYIFFYHALCMSWNTPAGQHRRLLCRREKAVVGWYEVVDVVLSEGKNCCRGGFKTVLRSKLSEMGRGSSRWFSRCNCQSERILLTAKWWGRERERCHATRPKRPLILIFQSVDIVLSSITHSHASATIELQTLIAGCSTLLESRLKATMESNSAKSFRFVCSV